MSFEIYCFSGTGNSLRVAKELVKRLPEGRLYPIVGLLKEKEVVAQGQVVGFIFPVYCHTVPPAVKRFIKRIDLKFATYVFAVATTDATQCRAFIEIEKVLKKQGKRLDAYFVLKMAHNMPFYIRYAEFTEQKKLEKMDVAVEKALSTILQIVTAKKQHRVNDPRFLKPFPPVLLPLMPALIPLNWLAVRKMTVFYADPKCNGCGTCEDVCLSEKIELIDQRPEWKANVECFQCQACINYCPKQSIQQKSAWFMKSYSESNSRHHDPSISAKDIAEQKSSSTLSLV